MERIKTWINKQLLLFKKSVGKICSGFLKFHRAMLVMGVAIFCFYIHIVASEWSAYVFLLSFEYINEL